MLVMALIDSSMRMDRDGSWKKRLPRLLGEVCQGIRKREIHSRPQGAYLLPNGLDKGSQLRSVDGHKRVSDLCFSRLIVKLWGGGRPATYPLVQTAAGDD